MEKWINKISFITRAYHFLLHREGVPEVAKNKQSFGMSDRLVAESSCTRVGDNTEHSGGSSHWQR